MLIVFKLFEGCFPFKGQKTMPPNKKERRDEEIGEKKMERRERKIYERAYYLQMPFMLFSLDQVKRKGKRHGKRIKLEEE